MGFVPILPPLAALILFAVWAMVLVIWLGLWRSAQVFTRAKKITDFPSGTEHGGGAYWRLNRAHINTIENLPVFGALVLTGAYLQVQHPAFLVLPTVVLYARIVQSIIHVSSGSALGVTLRFGVYVVQVAAMLAMAGPVLRATGLPMPW